MRRTALLGFCSLLASAFLFAVSGPIAKTLYDGGWSPGAVLLVRVAGSAIVLLPATAHALRGHWALVARHWGSIVAYGAVCFAGMQGFFFLAIEHLSVTLAQLIQMTAPVMVVFWLWLRTRRRPSNLTFLGVAVAVGGILLLLDPRGSPLSLAGVLLAFAAALCTVVYFLVSAKQRTPLPPAAYIGLSMAAGALVVMASGAARIIPLEFTLSDVPFAGLDLPAAVPLMLLVVFTVAAYLLGIVGLRCIGPTVGSFTSFSEVPFAALAAWILLAEFPDPALVTGGMLILGGIALVKCGDIVSARRRRTAAPATVP
ncbi:DMT family transporter [Leucobacter sp. wl10]|uniref:EamA family transporter n=1 Tax=Leucobacter sp. wl10 TaxID=2304677 RepID=UPI000E5B0E2C|nr:DMT family transporter [Leucobacter sp. wl10]RGE21948.1 EamA family transporter [Leucobacter sp. wl10]